MDTVIQDLKFVFWSVGRLLPGVSIEQAQTDLSRITQAIRESKDETAAAPEEEKFIETLDTKRDPSVFLHGPGEGSSAARFPSLRERSDQWESAQCRRGRGKRWCPSS